MKRSTLCVFLTVTAVASASAGIATAQQAQGPAAQAPAVETLVARALGRAPSLAAQRARVDAAESSLRAAGTLPNPMIEFEYRDFNFPRYTIGSSEMSMAGASIRQDLSSKGRRAAERQVAQAQIGERAAEQDVIAADLATGVRVLYARLYALDRERATLADAGELVSMLVATAASRYAAGQSDQASVLRAQLEQTQVGQRLVDIATERIGVQAALNRLTDDPPDTPIGAVTGLPDLPPVPALAASAPEAQAGSRSPEVIVRERAVAVASRQVDAAREELRPRWGVGGGLYWQGGFDRTVTFNVGLELPFRKDQKERPLIAAAEHELHAAQLDVQGAAATSRAEATRLAAEWRGASEQIDRSRTAILPQNSAAFDATRSSYLAGRGDFVSVLEEFRRWIEVRIALATREADRFSAAARLQALTGGPLK